MGRHVNSRGFSPLFWVVQQKSTGDRKRSQKKPLLSMAPAKKRNEGTRTYSQQSIPNESDYESDDTHFFSQVDPLLENNQRLKAALAHFQRNRGTIIEHNLVQDVVSFYRNKGEFRQKKRIMFFLFISCPIPFSMHRFKSTELLLAQKSDLNHIFSK